MKPRRRARCLTLETLYEYDVAEHEPFDVLQRRLTSLIEDEDEPEELPLSENARTFSVELMSGVIDYQSQIDGLISRFAPEWPLDQIAVIDRNILRLAIFEILLDENTPTKVAINEAVELAKIYGSDSAPRFVNGVLGTLTDNTEKLRAEVIGAVLQ